MTPRTAARVRNWHPLLVGWARDVLGRPFVPGETDCASLAVSALTVLRGENPFCCLPSYDDERSMVAAHRETGGIQLKVLDVAEGVVRRSFARDGDLVTGFDPDARLGSVGVVLNGRVITSDRDLGVHAAPIAEVDGTYWRVP